MRKTDYRLGKNGALPIHKDAVIVCFGEGRGKV